MSRRTDIDDINCRVRPLLHRVRSDPKGITMPTTPIKPVLIRRADAPAVYGFSERQLKRWTAEGRLSRVYPAGPTGPCFLLTAELDDLIRQWTVPPGKKAGRKPSKGRA